jgi:hypothetical protein
MVKSRTEPASQSKNSIRPGRSSHQRARSSGLKPRGYLCRREREAINCAASEVEEPGPAVHEAASTASSRGSGRTSCKALEGASPGVGIVSISSIDGNGAGGAASERIRARFGTSRSLRLNEREPGGTSASALSGVTARAEGGDGTVSISSMCSSRPVARGNCRGERGGAVGVSEIISESEERLLAAS